ncbi:MAG TPA: hypothetical protein VKS01_08925 [Bryobacteraceae bacterium]|nr:hypothetical protein [Bryobacteraceae bacterium]
MGKINLGRVILGGLVAGVVINIVEGVTNGVLLAQRWNDSLSKLGQHAVTTKQIIAFNVWGFAVGILTVWLYAAIRSRMGAGARTGLCAGAFMWAAVCALAVAPPVFLHIYPLDLSLTALAIELPEMLIAAVAGAALYKENGAEAARASSVAA